jgi:hypothetical protein
MLCLILFLFAINPYSYSIVRALTFHSNTQQTISWQKSSFRIYFSERWDLSKEDESKFEEDIEDFEEEEGEDIESTSIPIMGSKVRLRARVAYDGTGFGGWQFQNKGRTVQVRTFFHRHLGRWNQILYIVSSIMSFFCIL